MNGSRTIASRRLISGGNDGRHYIRSREASNKLIKLSSLINWRSRYQGVFFYSRFGGFHKRTSRGHKTGGSPLSGGGSEMSERIMSDEFDGLDATEKAAVESTLYRCRHQGAEATFDWLR